MPFEGIGVTVMTVGGILGIVMIIFGGLLYLIGNKNKVMIATTARTLGAGIMTLMVSIPFSIPNHLLVESTSDEFSVFGVIVLSVFLGLPLIFMGLASFIGLNEKAQQILNSTTAEDQLEHYSPILKK
jgi:cell shape-determining protein MreD